MVEGGWKRRTAFFRAPTFAGLVVLLLAATGSPTALASNYPVLPLADWGLFIENLSAPVLAPGSSGTISLVLHDPLATDLSGVWLALKVYAFNAYPGNATGPVPGTSAPILSLGNSSGASVELGVSALGTGLATHWSVAVNVPNGAASGTYAIRISLSFNSSGTAYLLESRGFFTDQVWRNATQGQNGSSILNASRLGVSGVIPESAVLVRSNPLPYALYGILAAALVLAGLGGYFSLRRGPGSRSGRRASREPQSAPRALGKSRTRDGD